MEGHQGEHEWVKPKEHQKEETVTFSKVTLWKGVSGMFGLLLVLSVFYWRLWLGK